MLTSFCTSLNPDDPSGVSYVLMAKKSNGFLGLAACRTLANLRSPRHCSNLRFPVKTSTRWCFCFSFTGTCWTINSSTKWMTVDFFLRVPYQIKESCKLELVQSTNRQGLASRTSCNKVVFTFDSPIMNQTLHLPVVIKVTAPTSSVHFKSVPSDFHAYSRMKWPLHWSLHIKC